MLGVRPQAKSPVRRLVEHRPQQGASHAVSAPVGVDHELGARPGNDVSDIEVGVPGQRRAVVAVGAEEQEVADRRIPAVAEVEADVLGQRAGVVGLRGPLDEPRHRVGLGDVEPPPHLQPEIRLQCRHLGVSAVPARPGG